MSELELKQNLLKNWSMDYAEHLPKADMTSVVAVGELLSVSLLIGITFTIWRLSATYTIIPSF